ncbi:hypothetical protein BN2476_110109 [Paraburkholderia piptadeniae]|uniref:Uncharacterized protein n=1 Tax=Paraburkholderia piptadeniae TaxID=1701573 RepID=A0A1N7RPU8_9BURK|nr:CHAT domain-containing protein [Paraburkholderia piptadeniae]SIT37116.1 hypothetical protein BN2476_110109 [Paraburkholderia piptadeniae]
MLKPALTLDASMSPAAVLERLAMNGFWKHPGDNGAAQYLKRASKRTGKPVEEIAKFRGRPLDAMLAAIRAQHGSHVCWYVKPLDEVINICLAHPHSVNLWRLLARSRTPAADVVTFRAGTLGPYSVVLDGHEAIAAEINIPRVDMSLPVESPRSEADRQLRDAAVLSGAAMADPPRPRTPANVKAWPRIDAPDIVHAGTPFTVTVGFSDRNQSGVAGAQVVIPSPEDGAPIDMTVQLSAAMGVRACAGWTRPLRFRPDKIANAQVTFELVGDVAPTAEPLLTMLEVRYVVGGTVTGIASRALTIVDGHGSRIVKPSTNAGMQNEAPPVSFTSDADAPDLTIEIAKPDRNAANGQYVCTLVSPHRLRTERGPFHIDLGQDAKTLAKELVEEVRMTSGDALLDLTLESHGRLIAERLPAQVFQAIAEVAQHCAPKTPAVLIVSAEPYVPWELAWMDSPIDASQPGWLGCQTLLGRWLRIGDSYVTPTGILRPSAQPVASIGVRNLAVMAAWYKLESGLRRLKKAEDEARALAKSHAACEMEATSEAVRDLLQRTLGRLFPSVDGVEAVHFAGHGDFDPARPDASALFLSNGTPLRSTVFRAARYGGVLQPLMFLNACMLGIGGELLGDMGGFPGNALRGGFGGVLSALWEVDDQVAHDIALEFWKRALPPPPARGEPVGAILRSLRGKYRNEAKASPESTYLAYVYYGHPRLTLTRVA